MGQVINLKSLLHRVNSIIGDLNSLMKAQASANTYGKTQEISRRIALCKAKLKDYLEKVKNAGKGNIIYIEYIILDNNRTYQSTYVNISKEDAKNLLEFIYRVKGINIKILEIRETFTSFENPIL